MHFSRVEYRSEKYVGESHAELHQLNLVRYFIIPRLLGVGTKSDEFNDIGRHGLSRVAKSSCFGKLAHASFQYSTAQHEAQTPTKLTEVVRQAQVPPAQHHRAHVWLAEGKPPSCHAF